MEFALFINLLFPGAQLLNISIKHVPVDPVTMKVNLKAMKKMISRNTCMVSCFRNHTCSESHFTN